jgi:hypothetical protein
MEQSFASFWKRENRRLPMPNPAASVDEPIALLFAFVRPWRRATEQRRSSEEL